MVCKSDLGAPAQKLAADLRGALSLSLRAGQTLDVMMVSQQDIEGVRALAGRLAAWPRDFQARRKAQAQTWLRSVITVDFGRQGWRRLSDAHIRLDGSPFATARACFDDLSARLNRE